MMGLSADADSGLPKPSYSSSPPNQPSSPAQTDRSSMASVFQVQRTAILLNEWASRFPLPASVIAAPGSGTTPGQTPSGATPLNPTSTSAPSTNPSATNNTVSSTSREFFSCSRMCVCVCVCWI
ncbi:unnamed protein product [Echinostoma caproni]|uniref:Uncharacterized protein n=1 Tax=Echinostoma caproni TaxID=27848 RepID=A0A3P8J3G6_9TREM|nr:unnamed protein product [Echinostoma caproni]